MSHTRPGLHELPPQHGWSRSPQRGGVVHWSATQARVPVQVEPGQQGWPSVPQAWHIAETHAKPAWQMSPAQHAWPAAPHAADGAVHMPPVQVVPSQQSALDAQRPIVPMQQRPPVQEAPSQQSVAAMHAALGGAQQAPSRQSKPVSHAVPPQQRWPPCPQRSGGGSTGPGPGSVSGPSPRSSFRPLSGPAGTEPSAHAASAKTASSRKRSLEE